jgi:hypothetical protein
LFAPFFALLMLAVLETLTPIENGYDYCKGPLVSV